MTTPALVALLLCVNQSPTVVVASKPLLQNGLGVGIMHGTYRAYFTGPTFATNDNLLGPSAHLYLSGDFWDKKMWRFTAQGAYVPQVRGNWFVQGQAVLDLKNTNPIRFGLVLDARYINEHGDLLNDPEIRAVVGRTIILGAGGVTAGVGNYRQSYMRVSVLGGIIGQGTTIDTYIRSARVTTANNRLRYDNGYPVIGQINGSLAHRIVNASGQFQFVRVLANDKHSSIATQHIQTDLSVRVRLKGALGLGLQYVYTSTPAGASFLNNRIAAEIWILH